MAMCNPYLSSDDLSLRFEVPKLPPKAQNLTPEAKGLRFRVLGLRV